jgi:phospholipid/cholesterol/gamma-HCH transport system ATP-binding protein
MQRGRPILELMDAVPRAQSGPATHAPLSLKLLAGDFVLIECVGPAWAAGFADICCGVWPLQHGAARFFDRDWTGLSHVYTAALRGRIGRVFHDGGWISFLDMETNILLPQLHHTRRATPELRAAAAELAHDFGLPGLPVGLPGALSGADQARAACIRAFLGDPLLVLLECPLQGQSEGLAAPLVNAVLAACNQGAAALWLTSGDAVWADRAAPATARLRLSEQGLSQVRRIT